MMQTISKSARRVEARARSRSAAGKGVRLGLLLFSLAAAYALRVLYPDLYMVGYDMPAHTMAALRLHLTAPFTPLDGLDSFWRQIILFNHGYTTIVLPWLLYELVFGLLQVTITETTLVYVNSLLGLLSLVSIFLFMQLNFQYRIALITSTLIAVLPIHIGLSRVHVGTQIIASIFFFASLSCLQQYLTSRQGRWKAGFYLTTFFYIGSENLFIIGLGLQGLYLLLLGGYPTWRARLAALRDLYLTVPAGLALGLPLAVYVAAAAYALYAGLDGGYLLRVVNKVSGMGKTNLASIPTWAFNMYGPALFIFLLALIVVPLKRWWQVSQKASSCPPAFKFLLVMLVGYFGLVNLSQRTQAGYLFYLMLPLAAITAFLLRRSTLLYALTLAATLIYALAVVYTLNLPIPAQDNYGSVTSHTCYSGSGCYSSLQATKTLGYLLRTGALRVSQVQTKHSSYAAILLDNQAAFYYFGLQSYREPLKLVDTGELDKLGVYLVAVQTDSAEEENVALRQLTAQRQLAKVAEITGQGTALLELYANAAPAALFDLSRLPSGQQPENNKDGLPRFAVERYNPLFDQAYGNLEQLPRLYLGQFGYLVDR